jgi:hypothetical protein
MNADNTQNSDNAQPEGNQGEGNKEADRHYREKTRDFVESGRVDDAARRSAPTSAEEAEELRRAEEEGRSRAREEDPALRRGESADDGSQRR